MRIRGLSGLALNRRYETVATHREEWREGRTELRIQWGRLISVVQGFMTLVTEVASIHAGSIKDFEGTVRLSTSHPSRTPSEQHWRSGGSSPMAGAMSGAGTDPESRHA